MSSYVCLYIYIYARDHLNILVCDGTMNPHKISLLIFDVVVRSKLLYGLETIHLIGAMLKKIDAFQMRCLRRASTFHRLSLIDDIPTELFCKDVQQSFTQIKATNGNLNCSASLSYRKSNFLDHVLGPEDPMRQIFFQPNSAITHRIHGAAIYGNMDPINIPPLC